MAQQLINALGLASVYMLFGLGFNLILGALNILNVAQAALFSVGAYLVYWLMTAVGIPFLAAMLLAVVATGVVSVLVNELALGPLRRRHSGGLIPLVASLGASMVILAAVQTASGAQILRLPAGAVPDTIWNIGSTHISLILLLAVVSAGVLVVLTNFLLRSTDFGKAIRATEFSETAAKFVGIPTERVVRSTFFISGILAGAAGVITALLFNSVSFLMGEPYLLKGFVIVVLGGFGSVRGTVFASFILAAVETVAVAAGYAGYRDAFAFSLLILILLLRPTGLFRSPERARA